MRRTSDDLTCASGMDGFLHSVALAILQSGERDEFALRLDHHINSWIANSDQLDDEV